MARLPNGTAPVPHKIRLKGYRVELEKRGGRRLNADIEAKANAALAVIMAALTARMPRAKIKDAITDALVNYASTLKPEPR